MPAPAALMPLLLSLVVLFSCASLPACTASPEMPLWFDSFERLPVNTVTVGGHRIAYLDRGEGPSIVLIHGFGGSMWQWEYQQTALSQGHRLITLDLLGSGLSDKPDMAYTPEDMVAFFTGFLDALGLAKATLVGNSMGAGLAMGMALAHPERVERLVLIAGLPAVIHEDLTGPLIRRALDSRVPVWLAEFGNWVLGRSVTEAVLEEIVCDHSLLTPAVVERAYRNRERPGLVPAAMAVARSIPLWEAGFATRLRDIAVPTLIVWGDEDRVFAPRAGTKLAAAIPGARLERIAKAGHMPQWERPEPVNRLILDFARP